MMDRTAGHIFKKSFVQRLAGYSTLALAGLSAEPAVAGIIASGPGFVPVTVAPSEVKGISFGGSLGSIFQFNEFAHSTSYLSALIQRGPNAVATQSIVANGNDPRRLGPGYLINAGLNWYANATGTTNDVGGGSAGAWNSANPGTVVRGFLGVRFNLGDGAHYGFFDVSYDNTPNRNIGTMTIWGWAYEDSADTAITTGASGAVPEPATALPIGLGLLALGAAGNPGQKEERSPGRVSEIVRGCECLRLNRLPARSCWSDGTPPTGASSIH